MRLAYGVKNMKKNAIKLLAFFSLTLLGISAILTPMSCAAQPKSIAAQVIIVDMNTGNVLFEKNADQRMPTSSMSKVMSMYVVFDAIKKGRLSLDDKLVVSENAWRKGGSKMFVEVGKRVRVEDLIKGVIIQSGNDAAIVLAENLSGSEENFGEALTRKAKELEMNSSNFVNASGWPDPNHYSTARDLSILAQRLITDFPEHYKYYGMQEFTYSGIKQANRNPLLYRKIGVDGIKTGHTDAAGYGLMASGERDGRRVVMVINGLKSEKERASESARLMEWALASFDNEHLYKAKEALVEAPVVYGKKEKVSIGLKDDVFLSIPNLKKDDVKIEAIYNTPLIAPIPEGQEVGKLLISVPDQKNYVFSLFALDSVNESGFIAKAFQKLLAKLD